MDAPAPEDDCILLQTSFPIDSPFGVDFSGPRPGSGAVSNRTAGFCCGYRDNDNQVLCEDNSTRIVSVKLRQKDPSAPVQLPPQLGNLTRLEQLLLPHNSFSGDIPSTFASLERLRVLDLSFNNLDGLFPGWVADLPNLQRLNLAKNNFNGNVPSNLGVNAKALDFIDAHGNSLTGSLPESLATGSIQYLNRDLSGNFLDGGIPQAYGAMSGLLYFNASFNNLNGEVPASFGGLNHVTILDLSFNALSGALPTELGNMTQITQLFLNNNNFGGAVPAGLARLQNLTDLRLQYNHFTSIPQSVVDIPSLKSLDLRDNCLSTSNATYPPSKNSTFLIQQTRSCETTTTTIARFPTATIEANQEIATAKAKENTRLWVTAALVFTACLLAVIAVVVFFRCCYNSKYKQRRRSIQNLRKQKAQIVQESRKSIASRKSLGPEVSAVGIDYELQSQEVRMSRCSRPPSVAFSNKSATWDPAYTRFLPGSPHLADLPLAPPGSSNPSDTPLAPATPWLEAPGTPPPMTRSMSAAPLQGDGARQPVVPVVPAQEPKADEAKDEAAPADEIKAASTNDGKASSGEEKRAQEDAIALAAGTAAKKGRRVRRNRSGVEAAKGPGRLLSRWRPAKDALPVVGKSPTRSSRSGNNATKRRSRTSLSSIDRERLKNMPSEMLNVKDSPSPLDGIVEVSKPRASSVEKTSFKSAQEELSRTSSASASSKKLMLQPSPNVATLDRGAAVSNAVEGADKQIKVEGAAQAPLPYLAVSKGSDGGDSLPLLISTAGNLTSVATAKTGQRGYDKDDDVPLISSIKSINIASAPVLPAGTSNGADKKADSTPLVSDKPTRNSSKRRIVGARKSEVKDNDDDDVPLITKVKNDAKVENVATTAQAKVETFATTAPVDVEEEKQEAPSKKKPFRNTESYRFDRIESTILNEYLNIPGLERDMSRATFMSRKTEQPPPPPLPEPAANGEEGSFDPNRHSLDRRFLQTMIYQVGHLDLGTAIPVTDSVTEAAMASNRDLTTKVATLDREKATEKAKLLAVHFSQALAAPAPAPASAPVSPPVLNAPEDRISSWRRSVADASILSSPSREVDERYAMGIIAFPDRGTEDDSKYRIPSLSDSSTDEENRSGTAMMAALAKRVNRERSVSRSGMRDRQRSESRRRGLGASLALAMEREASVGESVVMERERSVTRSTGAGRDRHRSESRKRGLGASAALAMEREASVGEPVAFERERSLSSPKSRTRSESRRRGYGAALAARESDLSFLDVYAGNNRLSQTESMLSQKIAGTLSKAESILSSKTGNDEKKEKEKEKETSVALPEVVVQIPPEAAEEKTKPKNFFRKLFSIHGKRASNAATIKQQASSLASAAPVNEVKKEAEAVAETVIDIVDTKAQEAITTEVPYSLKYSFVGDEAYPTTKTRKSASVTLN
ncbi:hypothetical protein HDU96_010527 [Phlyctochytrium bullatum]|nr:hypothetical protein HDU96_010527 [Phlyctochytrium bullatum]